MVKDKMLKSYIMIKRMKKKCQTGKYQEFPEVQLVYKKCTYHENQKKKQKKQKKTNKQTNKNNNNNNNSSKNQKARYHESSKMQIEYSQRKYSDNKKISKNEVH